MKLFKNISRLVAATATVGLLMAPMASADQGRRGHDDRGSHYSGKNDYRGHDRRDGRRGDRRDDRRDHRRDDRRDYRHDNRGKNYNHHYSGPRYYGRAPARVYYAPPRYYAPPPRYAPRYSVGGYYHPHPQTVYIRDYGRYGLYDPPRGYYWARDYDRGDAILASVATGAIIGLAIGVIGSN
tara:strand:+ start:8882 stop:9427 length:546 start_codon:yes stop_codon:yes gene_type:complete